MLKNRCQIQSKAQSDEQARQEAQKPKKKKKERSGQKSQKEIGQSINYLNVKSSKVECTDSESESSQVRRKRKFESSIQSNFVISSASMRIRRCETVGEFSGAGATEKYGRKGSLNDRHPPLTERERDDPYGFSERKDLTTSITLFKESNNEKLVKIDEKVKIFITKNNLKFSSELRSQGDSSGR